MFDILCHTSPFTDFDFVQKQKQKQVEHGKLVYGTFFFCVYMFFMRLIIHAQRTHIFMVCVCVCMCFLFVQIGPG